MNKSIWHRFPKNDYQEIKYVLEKMIQWSEEKLGEKEKNEIVILISSIEEGFLTKKNENLKLDFLIQCLEFFFIENENNQEGVKLKKKLDYFYNYQSKGGSLTG